MKKLELTQEEHDKLNTIKICEKSILESEKKLIELESLDQQNSPEYKSIINSIKGTLYLEESLLSKLFSSNERIIVFFMEYGDPLHTNQLETFITPSIDKLTTTRIINYFYNKIIFDKNDDSNKHIHAVAINTNTGKTLPINPDSILRLEEAIKSDIIYTLIKLLNIEIKNCNNQELKKELIKNKYELLFMFPNIKKALENNPSEDLDLYYSHKFISDYYKIDKGLYRSILFKTTAPLFDLSVNPLANMNDQDFKNNKHLGILYTLLLRTCLILNEEDFYNALKEQITYQTIILNRPNTEGINQISNILERVKEDKKIPKTITLARKKED